ncbi:lactococcin 972 family bacteriocin [Staphylococcus simiae]
MVVETMAQYVWSYYYHGYKGHSSTAIGRYKSNSRYTKPGK